MSATTRSVNRAAHRSVSCDAGRSRYPATTRSRGPDLVAFGRGPLGRARRPPGLRHEQPAFPATAVDHARPGPVAARSRAGRRPAAGGGNHRRDRGRRLLPRPRSEPALAAGDDRRILGVPGRMGERHGDPPHRLHLLRALLFGQRSPLSLRRGQPLARHRLCVDDSGDGDHGRHRQGARRSPERSVVAARTGSSG